jgi:uncharacterized protein
MNHCIVTRTGRVVDLVAPDPRSINLIDIALALSRIPRFGGHTSREWTVADHSLLVCDLVGTDAPVEVRLAALLHDAHEAYIGDIVSPVAAMLMGGRSALAERKRRIDDAIGHAFALEPGYFDFAGIAAADQQALAIEVHHLMAEPSGIWDNLVVLDFIPELPKTDAFRAQTQFLIRAFSLVQEMRHGQRAGALGDMPDPRPQAAEPMPAATEPSIKEGTELVQRPGATENG